MASQIRGDTADSTTSPRVALGDVGVEAGGSVPDAHGNPDVLGESDQHLRDLELDTFQ